MKLKVNSGLSQGKKFACVVSYTLKLTSYA